MKKRLLSLLLALTLLCGVLPQTALPARAESPYSGDCGDNLTWTFNPDTATLTIEGFGEMWDSWEYNDSSWRENLAGAIESVVLPDGLTSIGEKAFFECIGLLSVTIPDSVTSIGDGAFDV